MSVPVVIHRTDEFPLWVDIRLISKDAVDVAVAEMHVVPRPEYSLLRWWKPGSLPQRCWARARVSGLPVQREFLDVVIDHLLLQATGFSYRRHRAVQRYHLSGATFEQFSDSVTVLRNHHEDTVYLKAGCKSTEAVRERLYQKLRLMCETLLHEIHETHVLVAYEQNYY